MSGSPLRALQRDLAEACDAKLIRATAMVDTMEDRGGADALIAPLRARLTRLKPRRPLTFMRVLFAPLDPLLVAAAKWQRGSPSIPRSLLPCVGAQVLACLGAERSDIEGLFRGACVADLDAVAAASGPIWSQAARILAVAEMPADWQARTGLPPRDYRPLVAPIAALLADAEAIRALTRPGPERGAWPGMPAPPPEEIEALLEGMIPAGDDALAMLVVLLNAGLPRSRTLMRLCDDLAARQSDPAVRAASDRAFDHVLDGYLADGTDGSGIGQDIGQAAGEVGRMANLLDDLEQRSGQSATRRTRIGTLRRQMDRRCRDQFSAGLTSQLLVPAAALPDAASPEEASDQEIAALEGAARALRRYEAEGRKLGGGAHYDRALEQAGRQLAPTGRDSRASRMDRVRLVEILQGSEAAEALLSKLD